MIYPTKQIAILTLIEFTPAMRAKHKVIRATVDGKPAGWTVVMRGKVSK